MKRFGSVVVAGVVMVALVGCSGSDAEEPTPTETESATTSSASPADEASADASANDCSVPEADDDVDVSFGEMAAASDEWSADLGREWRHYYPMTITNVSTATCIFNVGVEVLVDGESVQQDDIYISLSPGQKYSMQAFSLEEAVDFATDSETAEPAKTIAPRYIRTMKRDAEPNYYDAEFAFGDIQGSGANAVLPLTITNNGVADGKPERSLASLEDRLIVNGLDAAGDVVASLRLVVDPVIVEGETREVQLPLGGGSSSGIAVLRHPASDFLDAVTFEVAEYVPSVINLH